jgi:hypothetical protein
MGMIEGSDRTSFLLEPRAVFAQAPKSKNAKVTFVYQHELPNCPGNSIKRLLVKNGSGGYSPGHTHAKSAFIYDCVPLNRSTQRNRIVFGDNPAAQHCCIYPDTCGVELRGGSENPQIARQLALR